jgi:diketogulonate reductase-like aldo/keto reductase
METQPFGRTGVQVPVIGQGTWKIESNPEVVATLRRGVELGMTHIDTAELYTGAEAVLGEALGERWGELFLVSKVLPEHGRYEDTLAACEKSLRALRADALDLYLLHWHEGQHPIAETMRAMKALVHEGKVRHVGVSNFSVQEMEEAARALDPIPLACNQVRYHLGDRSAEQDVIPWCEAEQVAVVGYSPFAPLQSGTSGWRALEEVGAGHGKSVHQVALRYLTRRPGLFAIPKASTRAHVEANAAGQGFVLSPADVAAIESAWPV